METNLRVHPTDSSPTADARVSGNWDFEFVAANYNDNDDMVFLFQSINIWLLLKNQQVPAYMTVLQPFELGPKTFTTHIFGKFSGSSEFLDDSSTKLIANEIKTNGEVEFDVKLESSVKNQHFGTGLLKAYCDIVKFVVSPDTESLHGSEGDSLAVRSSSVSYQNGCAKGSKRNEKPEDCGCVPRTSLCFLGSTSTARYNIQRYPVTVDTIVSRSMPRLRILWVPESYREID
ncbi:hypothetical protein AgCh_006237 [Apium graveolens]